MPSDISFEKPQPVIKSETLEAPSILLTEKSVPITAPESPEVPVSHPTPSVQVKRSTTYQEGVTKLPGAAVSERIEQHESADPAPLSPIHEDGSAASEIPSIETRPGSTESDTDHPITLSKQPKSNLSPTPVEAASPKPKEAPERSNEIPHEAPHQPQHNILQAMVRQMVLQPISRQEPTRSELEPAETASNTASPASEPQRRSRDNLEREATDSLPLSTSLHSAPYPANTTPRRTKHLQNHKSGELASNSGPLQRPPKVPSASQTLKPLTPKIPPFPEVPQTTEVHISIGRVEVRATSEKAAAPTPPQRQSKPEVMSLDDYLAQRTGKKG